MAKATDRGLAFDPVQSCPGIVRDRLGKWCLDTTPPPGRDGFIESMERWAEGPSPVNARLRPKQVGQVFAGNDEDYNAWAASPSILGCPKIRSAKDFAAFARKGWPGAAEAYRREAKGFKVTPVERSFRRSTKWADDGDEIDVRRAIDAGSCDRAWQRSHRTEGSTKLSGVTIAVNHSAAGGVDGSTMLWRAITAISLVDAIEGAGLSCRVLPFDQGNGGYTNDLGRAAAHHGGGEIDEFIACVAKGYGEPVDLDRLLVAVCHPAVLRFGFFAAMLNAPLPTDGTYGGAISGLPIVNDGSGSIVIDNVDSRQHGEATLKVFCRKIDAGEFSPERPLVARDLWEEIAEERRALILANDGKEDTYHKTGA